MNIKTPNYEIISASEDTEYHHGFRFPDWINMITYMYYPGQKMGQGPEPHYHDCDEFWIFVTGRGHVWLDGKEYPFTPGTVVYTPMGSIHEFHAYTDFETIGLATRLERQKRAIHIHVDEYGPPERTATPFVVQGVDNTGPFRDRGPRCPFSEMRLVTFAEGEGLQKEAIPRDEYWLVLNGRIELTVDGETVELSGDVPHGDMVVMKKGTVRSIKAIHPAKLSVVRTI